MGEVDVSSGPFISYLLFISHHNLTLASLPPVKHKTGKDGEKEQ